MKKLAIILVALFFLAACGVNVKDEEVMTDSIAVDTVKVDSTVVKADTTAVVKTEEVAKPVKK